MIGDGRLSGGLTVDLGDLELAYPTVLDQLGQGLGPMRMMRGGRRRSRAIGRRVRGRPRARPRPAPRTAPAARAGRPGFSGHGSAAPNGWAGSVAASTSGAVASSSERIAVGPQPIDGARHRELCRSEAGHEVAPPHLAPLLERLEHRVHAGETAVDALAQRRLAGEHAVALEQLQRLGVRDLGAGGPAVRAAVRPVTTGRAGRRAAPAARDPGRPRRSAAAREPAQPRAPARAPASRW